MLCNINITNSLWNSSLKNYIVPSLLVSSYNCILDSCTHAKCNLCSMSQSNNFTSSVSDKCSSSCC